MSIVPPTPVTGMLAEVSDASCPAYAIGFDEEGYDEMAFARNTAKHFGVSLREYYVTPQDVVDELPKATLDKVAKNVLREMAEEKPAID